MMRLSSMLMVGTALLIGVVPASAEPVRPADDRLVLGPAALDRSGRPVELKSSADDAERLALALNSARASIEQGRANGDPRGYGQAQAALAPWWDDPNAPQAVRLLRAVIRQANHEFASASRDLDAILAEAPHDAQSRLSRAFLRMTTGDIEGAIEDCRALPAPSGRLVRAICMSRAAALSGGNEEARALLSRVLAAHVASDSPMIAFGARVLADIEVGLGRDGDARKLLAAAAESPTADVHAAVAFADFLLDAEEPRQMLEALEDKGTSDAVLLRRAIAAKRSDDPRLGAWREILNERFSAAARAGIRVHLREEARFRLEVENDSSAALALAIENWKVQKEPADAAILLKSALAARSPAAALPVVDFIRKTGLKDQRVTSLLKQLEAGL